MAHDELVILRPFDSHVHGRDRGLLQAVAPLTARQFAGAIFEPNLVPPITTAAMARAYRERILDTTCDYPNFAPYVLGYLTDTMDPNDLATGLDDGSFIGVKFYPRGATTNSGNGIEDIRTLWTRGTRQYELISTVKYAAKIVQLHCELNYDLSGNELDPYDKEPYFFKEIMPRLLDAHPGAAWSCEHLTCREGVNFMLSHGGSLLGCSITPHHLLYDRRDMFRGGLRPHLFCLPVIKASEHLAALRQLIALGKPFVYAGTDSAPHDRRKKECDCCSGGVFTAHAAVELYAQAFEAAGALQHFEAFMSVNGPTYYQVPLATDTITLRRTAWTVDAELPYSANPLDIVRPHGYEEDPDKRQEILWKFVD